MGLPEPHGGRLVDQTLAPAASERRRSEAAALPSVRLSEEAAFDLEKIAVGAYSPLTGFQGSADLEAILERGRLADGTPWSLPILLPQPPTEAIGPRGPEIGDEVLLEAPSGRPIGLLRLEEVYPIPKARVAERVYGTTDPAHPNVGDLVAAPSHAWAGPIQLLDWPDLPDRSLERTPSEMRARFQARGWSNVAAYQCRNPPHTAHELLQRQTLEREEIDGLLIHPVVGRLKPGDYRPQIILRAYRVLTERYLPADRVELASLSISMRYAGPRAALFLAIVRKNFGCRSYIVGRDQAGVGRYYEPTAAQRIFDEYPDLGVVPIRFAESFYCRRCQWMASPRSCGHAPADRIDTSQSRIRRQLADGEPLPPELLRPEVAEILREPDPFVPAAPPSAAAARPDRAEAPSAGGATPAVAGPLSR